MIYAVCWLGMVLIAVANGVVRNQLYEPTLGELRAHQVSTVIGMILMGVYIWLVIRIWPPASGAHAAAVGGLWLLMTVAFEFGFGHYVAGHSWHRLLADYNLFAGRIWMLLLAWVAVAPLLFFHLQRAG